MNGSQAPDSAEEPVENVSAPIDWATLRRQSGGDLALEREVLELFVAECSRAECVVMAGERAALLATAHRLKGTARSVGADRLGLACEAAEHMAAPADAPKRLLKEAALARQAATQRLRRTAGAS